MIKIKINNNLLKKVLNTIYKISYESSSVELNSFFIEVNENSLIVFGKNNVIVIQHKISASSDLIIEGKGRIIVNAFVFNELVQKTKEDIILELLESSVLLVKTKGYNTKINTISLDFWKTQNWELIGEKSLFTRNDIRLLINQISYATQNKEGKQIFQGVNFRSTNNKLVVTATDGSRIARRSFSSLEQDVDLILPLSALIETNRATSLNKVSEFHVIFGKERVLFEIGKEIKIISKIINGNFPNTEKQFVQNFETKITCQTDQLIAAIEKASIFFERNLFPVVSLQVKSGEFFVSSLEQNTIGSFEEKINSATMNGKEQSVNLQAKFVLTTLKSLENNKVLINFSSSSGPVLFSEEDNKELKVLILPFWVY